MQSQKWLCHLSLQLLVRCMQTLLPGGNMLPPATWPLPDKKTTHFLLFKWRSYHCWSHMQWILVDTVIQDNPNQCTTRVVVDTAEHTLVSRGRQEVVASLKESSQFISFNQVAVLTIHATTLSKCNKWVLHSHPSYVIDPTKVRWQQSQLHGVTFSVQASHKNKALHSLFIIFTEAVLASQWIPANQEAFCKPEALSPA